MSYAEKFSFNKSKENIKYEYFSDPIERHDIYEFSKGVSNYLHDNKIPNIILLDRSPRPFWVGIDEYWKENYKDEKTPNIYFLNPDSFDTLNRAKDKLDLDEEELLIDYLRLIKNGESLIMDESNRMDNDLINQFVNTYKKLSSEKEKPLAIFDNCIHSGNTITPVVSFLEKNGYDDLHIIIGETSSDFSNIRVDKEFTKNVKYKACGAFGRQDFGVVKNADKITSGYDKKSNRELLVKSRREIRNIVKDKGQ
jgi:hypothetical protein